MATPTTLGLGSVLTLLGALALRRGLYDTGLLATLRAPVRGVDDLEPDEAVRLAARVQPGGRDAGLVGPVSGDRVVLATVTRRHDGDERTRRVAVPFSVANPEAARSLRIAVEDGPDGPPREVLLTESETVTVPAGEPAPERVAALFPDERTDVARRFTEARLTAGEKLSVVGRPTLVGDDADDAADEGTTASAEQLVVGTGDRPFLLTDTATLRTALSRAVRDRRLAYGGGLALSLGLGFLTTLL